MLPNPTVTAIACVAAAVGIVNACAIIMTRRGSAVLNFNFTIGARIPGHTLASVRSLTGVGARSAIVTGLVIRTEIQILITKQTTPALFADAFPFFCACSVHASWIHFTFVTIWSLPSGLASVIFWSERRGEKRKIR